MTEVQETLCKVAKINFIRYGINSVSIEDLCNQSGISKKTFYLNYANKVELIRSVLDLLHNEKCATVEKKRHLMESMNVIDFIASFASTFVTSKEKISSILIYDLEKYYPDILHEYKKKGDLFFEESLERYITRGISEGLFREDMDIKNTVEYIKCTIPSIKQMKESSNKTAEEFNMFVIDLYLRILASGRGLIYYEGLKRRNQNK